MQKEPRLRFKTRPSCIYNSLETVLATQNNPNYLGLFKMSIKKACFKLRIYFTFFSNVGLKEKKNHYIYYKCRTTVAY